jgi:hypothetical protein
MKTELLKTSRRLWQELDYIPRDLVRKNQLKWAQAVQRLGDRWLLAHHIHKKLE